MSQLLYRLGQFATRRAWLVLVGWLTIFGIAGALAATSGGAFTTAMTIDGVPAQKTIDKLQSSFPDASRGTGQVIFHTANGKAFTEAEKAAIAKALEGRHPRELAPKASGTERLGGISAGTTPIAPKPLRLSGRDKVRPLPLAILDQPTI